MSAPLHRCTTSDNTGGAQPHSLNACVPFSPPAAIKLHYRSIITWCKVDGALIAIDKEKLILTFQGLPDDRLWLVMGDTQDRSACESDASAVHYRVSL